MSVLITGGTGFLGAELAHHLVHEEGLDGIVLFDREPRAEVVADIRDAVHLVAGEVLDQAALVRAIDQYGVDRIAHLAFPVGVVNPEQIPGYVEVTCLGTARVYEAARLTGLTRVVDASSCAVYGNEVVASSHQQSPSATEDDPPHPTNIYGAIKVATEQMAETYNSTHGMEVLTLRVTATFGPGRSDRWSRLGEGGLTQDRRYFMGLPEFAFRGDAVSMPLDDALADFLYVKDAARAFALALLTPTRPAHSVFNLRGEQRPIGDMTRYLRTVVPGTEITVSDEPIMLMRLMDNERIVEELGFSPRFTIESGLDDHFARLLATT